MKRFWPPPSDVIDTLAKPLLNPNLTTLNAYYKEVRDWRSEQHRLWETLRHLSDDSLKQVLDSRDRTERLAHSAKTMSDEIKEAIVRLLYLELKIRKRRVQFSEQVLKLVTMRVATKEQLNEIPRVSEVINLRRAYYRDEDPVRRQRILDQMRKRADRVMSVLDARKDHPSLVLGKTMLKDAKRSFLSISTTFAKWRIPLKTSTAHAISMGGSHRPEAHPPERDWDTHSGFRYWDLSTQFDLQHNSSPIFMIHRALWRENLGDHRAYGVGPTRGLTLVDSTLSIEWNETIPKVLGVVSKIFELTSFAQSLDEETTFSMESGQQSTLFGWRASSTYYGSRGAKSLDLDLGFGVLAPAPHKNLWQTSLMIHVTPRVSNHPTLWADASLINQPERYGLSSTLAQSSAPLVVGSSASVRGAVSYRVGYTGRLVASGRYTHMIHQGMQWNHTHWIHTQMALEFPLSTDEAFRLNTSVTRVCHKRCGYSLRLGLAL